MLSEFGSWKIEEALTGDGRCNLCAAIFSPGASKVTDGVPKVTARRLARAPPRL